MGKLIVTEFMTLDGVAQAPGAPDEDREGGFPYGGWQAPLETPESGGNVVFEEASTMDALLLGRKTYEIFAAYWPFAPDEIPFTGLLNRVPKYVASRTLRQPLEWTNSHLISGELSGAVRDLKDRYEEVHVIGSLNLLQSLLGHGLVDRLNLWQYPIVLGAGKWVFAEGVVPTVMHLAESKVYRSGLLHLEYEPAGPPSFGRVDAAHVERGPAG